MPTIVLVAGANLGAWAWEHVTPRLAAAGHDVHPLTLTGFGDRAHLTSPQITLGTHADDIVAALEVADLRDVVLVAHSYAGAPATLAAARVPGRIARLVYVAGAVPEPGKSLFETAEPGFEQAIRHFADTEGDGWLVPMVNDEVLDMAYGDHGLSDDHKAWLRARGVGQPLGCYTDPAPADLGAVDRLPRTYVACDGDPGDPPIAPGTRGWEVVTIATGHWPMITAPADLAAVLDKAARG
ncbi:MAG TPA: alpha/beta hydrolase [Acidimicrobiales bacterium]|nr:alpha/beta hydrolase [Acidimicrobiales bacterium]